MKREQANGGDSNDIDCMPVDILQHHVQDSKEEIIHCGGSSNNVSNFSQWSGQCTRCKCALTGAVAQNLSLVFDFV